MEQGASGGERMLGVGAVTWKWEPGRAGRASAAQRQAVVLGPGDSWSPAPPEGGAARVGSAGVPAQKPPQGLLPQPSPPPRHWWGPGEGQQVEGWGEHRSQGGWGVGLVLPSPGNPRIPPFPGGEEGGRVQRPGHRDPTLGKSRLEGPGIP